MTETKLHFSRFEFKYVLSAEHAKELEQDMGYFMEYDPFVRELVGHYYDVRSLYFDDPSYTAFYNKIEGMHTRSKFRVRTYTNNAENNTVQFLEIKGRFNNLVFKHRTPLPDELHLRDDTGSALMDKIVNGTGGSTLGEQFQYSLYRKRISPIALVVYKRRPYISRFDPEFRLTFDSELKAIRSKSLFPPSSGFSERAILPGYTVVEVKFHHHLPSWFHRLIQAHELRHVSVSKICKAMEQLGMAQDPA